MPRLPIPGGDDGDWGTILNQFLSVSLSSTGTLNPGVVSNSQLDSSTQAILTSVASKYVLPSNGMPLSSLATTGTPSSTTYLRGDGAWSTPAFAPLGGNFYINNYGGSTSSSAAVNTAAYNSALAAAIAAGGGQIIFGSGTYNLNATNVVTLAGIKVIGQGKDITILAMNGSGNCIDFHPTNWHSLAVTDAPTASGLQGFTVTGDLATGTAAGIHYGDLPGSYLADVKVRDFASTGQIGWWLDNIVGHSEGISANGLEAINNTININYDVNAGAYPLSTVYANGTAYSTGNIVAVAAGGPVNFYSSIAGSTGQAPSGLATSNAYWTYLGSSAAQNSFSYGFWDWHIFCSASQDGIRFSNGAFMYGAKLFSVSGNVGAGTGNTGALFHILGAGVMNNAAFTYSAMSSCNFQVQVESDGNTGTGHTTILFGAPNAALTNGTNAFYGMGFLEFLAAGSAGWTIAGGGNNASLNFRFGPGQISGDSSLNVNQSFSTGAVQLSAATTLTSSESMVAVSNTSGSSFAITLPGTSAQNPIGSERKTIHNLSTSTSNITVQSGTYGSIETGTITLTPGQTCDLLWWPTGKWLVLYSPSID